MVCSEMTQKYVAQSELFLLCVAADRVKEIRTDARVNQVETDKMIQELIAEKQRLLKELENAKLTGGSMGYTLEGLLPTQRFL